jgi:hypothetical protein
MDMFPVVPSDRGATSSWRKAKVFGDSEHYIIPTYDSDNRRNSPRLGIKVSVSVLSVDERTSLHTEKTETLDVSSTGVRILLSYAVRVGHHLSITANTKQLQAKMAGFVVKWVQPYEGRFLVGAELKSTSDKWRIIED